MNKSALVFVAGHSGLVGSAIVRALASAGFTRVLTRTSKQMDLRNQSAVDQFFKDEKPECVFLAAARVGGIHANRSMPADFLRDNLQIQTNVIDAAYKNGARKLLFLGSSCIYPKFAVQPIQETSLLTGELEATNEWYAIAKIAGLKMCQSYRRQYGFNAISVMPTNLYGPGDNFDLDKAHVLPALLRKFHDARQRGDRKVSIWGTGTPRREFMHVDDLAAAAIFLMQTYESEELLNIGWGHDVSILELAEIIRKVVGFEGELEFDATKPDGTPRKLLDTTRLNKLGWKPSIELIPGIGSTYQWFVENQSKYRS